MTPVEAPDRSLTQRLEALDRANGIRTRRAVLKRDVKAGRVKAYDVVADPPEWAQTMKVTALLQSVPTFGRVKIDKTLGACRISPAKTLGGLSNRQRSELLARLVKVTGRTVKYAPSQPAPVPAGQPPQHMRALNTAQKIRLERSALHASVRALPRSEGRRRLATIFLDPPEYTGSALVVDVLRWPRYTTRTCAEGMLSGLGIGIGQRICDLTARRRHALSGLLAFGIGQNVFPVGGARYSDGEGSGRAA